MARIVAAICPALILVLVWARNQVTPLADWIVTTGTIAHVGFALTNMALALVGIVAAMINKTLRVNKVWYVVLMVLFVAVLGASHMSDKGTVMHTVAGVLMSLIPFVTMVLALGSRPGGQAAGEDENR